MLHPRGSRWGTYPGTSSCTHSDNYFCTHSDYSSTVLALMDVPSLSPSFRRNTDLLHLHGTALHPRKHSAVVSRSSLSYTTLSPHIGAPVCCPNPSTISKRDRHPSPKNMRTDGDYNIFVHIVYFWCLLKPGLDSAMRLQPSFCGQVRIVV